ncbi:Tat pathway signal protein [Methylobacterium oryzihabitans]|uniref:Tat pathway signal protein n=1 Tax=Methylobacterium oryzihabitans TaxID=2499852 RepID=UPI001FEA3901|nr:Tat pathway signal protein [Methylobacterium oryzihabitans]
MFTQGLPWYRARIGHLALDLLFCLVLSVVLLASALAQAAETPLRIELNKLSTTGETCQATMMVENGKGGAIKSLKLDLYAFDDDGVAQKRALVELGPVVARKTVLRQFEIAPTPCAKVGRVLLNDVAACEGGDLTRETCLERIEPASAKGAAPFVR